MNFFLTKINLVLGPIPWKIAWRFEWPNLKIEIIGLNQLRLANKRRQIFKKQLKKEKKKLPLAISSTPITVWTNSSKIAFKMAPIDLL